MMRTTLLTLFLLLACQNAHCTQTSAPQKSQPKKQLPLAEAYSIGKRYVPQNTDSALYYLGLITSRYNESNIGELNDDEQKLVGYSYYYQAGLQAYEKSDYEASVRSLITGEQICRDDTLLFRLQQTMVVVLVQLAAVMPTADNLQLANYYTEKCFRKACQYNITNQENIGYLNLFTFGMDEETRRRNRWATDSMLKRENKYDVFSIYVGHYSRAIDCLDRKKPAEALALLRTVRDKYVPLLDEMDLHFRAGNLLSMAYVFHEMGRRDSFYIYTRQSETIARENGYHDVLIDVYNNLVSYYNEENTPQQATHYKRLSMELRDSLLVSGGFDRLLKSGLLDKLSPDKKVSAETPIQWWPYALAAALVLLAVLTAVVLWRRRRHAPEVTPTETIANTITNTIANTTTPVDATKYQYSPLTEKKKDLLYDRIKSVMEDVNVIGNPDFSLNQLVEMANANQKYVSQVINERTGQSFYQLLAAYRIEEVCRRMSDRNQYGQLTIEGLARSVGFKNPSHFFVVFKRIKGITPAEYIEKYC